MYSNNKGSILIFTLIIFSMVSMITMMCIGLNYSNRTIFSLEYKETKLIEEALSGIEIANSNILKEVKDNLSKSNTEDEFYSYFLGNNFRDNVCDMSKITLGDVNIDISQSDPFYIDGFYNFKLTSNSKENSYSKKFQAKVKIKNPFIELEEVKNDEDNMLDFNQIKNSVNINELVKVYDYKEL